MDVLHVSIVSAACAALAALMALRVRSAPEMRDQGWLAVVAATGAAELLLNVVTYDPAVSDAMVVWATRGQVALISAHIAAWTAYHSAFMGLPLRRHASAFALLFAAGALALLPGVVLTDRISVRLLPGIGTVFRDAQPSRFGWLVFALLVVLTARVAFAFIAAWRQRVPWAGAHAAAIGIAAALGANDALVISGVYSGPYLIDLCFALPGGILLVATGGRVVETARALAALRESLEAQVAARTADFVASERRGRDAQQLALLGQMAAGVAHELTSPIAVAVSRVRALSDTLTQRYPGSGLNAELKEASIALLRVQRLAARVRNASLLVTTDGATAPVGLAAAIRMAVDGAAPELAKADVTVEVDPDAVAMANEAVVQQVVRDLVVSAADARRNDRRVRVAVRARVDGDRVRIEVEDDGVGTGSADASAGLGMAFRRSLARGLGGDLDLRTEPGRGTVATLELPAAKRLPE